MPLDNISEAQPNSSTKQEKLDELFDYTVCFVHRTDFHMEFFRVKAYNEILAVKAAEKYLEQDALSLKDFYLDAVAPSSDSESSRKGSGFVFCKHGQDGAR